ncbi:hypothetical protein [Rhizobium sp. Root708]|uniref:hypothetical protein n=1 Tax=Rhizobium sp. Root708 TaxID=1736592 RepID=UPI000AD6AA46|nr:hypothetical protein [Rhizobium sp. Root708]
MLSDAIKEMRERFREDVSASDPTGFLLALRAFELEARNMEDRIELLTGLPHVALDGRLVSAPSPVIALSQSEHSHG